MENKKSENPLVAEAFKVLLAMGVGALLTYANSMSNAQRLQGESLATMSANVATIVQQNTDFSARLSKVERAAGDNTKAIGDVANRVSVIEGHRYK